MELFYNYVLPFWLAGWIMIIWQIFRPAIRVIGEIDPDHVVYRWRLLTFLLFGTMSLAVVPIMMIPALVESYRTRFIYNYVRNLIHNETED